MEYTTRPLKWLLAPKGKPLFCEQGTLVEILDDAAGEYISVEQQADTGDPQKILIDGDEWPHLSELIIKAFAEIEKHEIKQP